MTTTEIKNSLHESINNINDEDFLLSVKELLESNAKPAKSQKLIEWQMKRIKSADKNIENGNFLTNEEADKLVEKWLNE